MAKGSGVKQITWIVCLVLYLVALGVHFGVLHIGRDIGNWSWIIGYAVLLLAIQLRGL